MVLGEVNTNTAIYRSAPSDRSVHPTVQYLKRIRLSERHQAEIEKFYLQGLSTRAVATRVGISKCAVLGVLKRREVEVRPQGNRY